MRGISFILFKILYLVVRRLRTYYMIYYLWFKAACAAASLAIGTRNGEQET